MPNRKRQIAGVMVSLSMAIGMVLGIPQAGSAVMGSDEDGAVVARDDRFTMWAGSGLPYLDVESNDTVADPYHRTPIVGFHRISKGKDGVRLDGGGLRLNMPDDRKADIVVEYQRQDLETGVLSNWATVTIKVKPTKEIRTKQPRPGRLKIINPNAGATHCVWGTPDGKKDSPDGQRRIKAKSSKVVKIHRSKLYFNCAIGQHGATTADRVLRGLK